MRKTVAKSIGCLLVFALIGTFLTGGDGGLAYFYPDSLDYKTQSEYTIFWGELPIYRSALSDEPNELLDFIRKEGFVKPISGDSHRRQLVFHWNRSWRDGKTPLYRVLITKRHEIIAWSKANPELAKIYWEEGFKLLRSDDKGDHYRAAEILRACWLVRNAEELRARIAEIKEE